MRGKRSCLLVEFIGERGRKFSHTLAAGVRLLIAARLITVRAVLRCLANMSSREPSGLRMYDDDAWVGGARERASRCRRPGFPRVSKRGRRDRLGEEILQEAPHPATYVEAIISIVVYRYLSNLINILFISRVYMYACLICLLIIV